MDQPEDVAEQFGVVWVLLQPDQFHVQNREILRRFGQKFAEQIIHDDISHAVFGLAALPSEPMNARRHAGRRSLRDLFSLPNTN